MEVGIAYRSVTPALGTALKGYYVERLADAVHDPLQVKAMVSWDGQHCFVLVVVDVIDVPATAYMRARAFIASEWGIPVHHVTIGSTHTHTGPFLTESYEDSLFEAILSAVNEARNHRIPVVLKAGSVEVHGLSFHRRYLMKDGSVRFNPGVHNPDVVRPAGPTDPEVGILVYETLSGDPHVIIVNFAIHLDTIGGTAISADFPYFLEQELQVHFQSSPAVLFVPGACGNINHINVYEDERLKSFDKAAQIGGRLAQAVIDHYPHLVEVRSSLFKIRAEQLHLRSPVYSQRTIQEALIAAEKESEEESSTPQIRTARKILRVANLDAGGLKAEVQVVAIGEVALVMLPTEIFVELGLAIKERSPFARTYVFTFMNFSVGYVPNRDAFDQGAYEVEVSMIEAGQGERLVDTALNLLDKLCKADH